MTGSRERRSRPLTLPSLRTHRRAILRVLDRLGLAFPRVFGLVATGDTNGGSDVDLAVEWAQGRRPRGHPCRLASTANSSTRAAGGAAHTTM